ncbi:MAG: D-glycerate dehydrogenase [bacterium]
MRIFLTRELPEAALNLLLKNGFEVDVYAKNKQISQAELIKFGKDADGILSCLPDKFTPEVINELANCKIIANYAVGYNNIDIKYAKSKNIIVTNTPGVLTNSTADLAVSLVLACARNVIAGHEMVSNGKFKGWAPKLLLGYELAGKTVGIIGAGRIGTETAIRLKSFGTHIIYYNRSKKKDFEEKTGAKKVNLDTLLKKADIVSLHIPLNNDTLNLISKEKLELLKPNAIVVNTARGEIIDEAALIELLKENKIFAAGFDVYQNEPDVNKDLLKLKNVVLLPHIGSASFEARTKMAEMAALNIINVLKGEKALNQVN